MRERTALPAALLARLPDLRLIVTTGPRNAVIDIAAAQAQGIVISGTMGNVTTTAEHTWALLLALQRNIVVDDRTMRAGGWQTAINRELAGSTLGIVGLGNIGRLIARIGAAFGMKVIAWSPNMTAERAESAGAIFATKQQLFATADVVTLQMVLSDSTRHLVGAEQLGWMKPTAVLINTSRGPLVDTDALIAALADGTIAGAALDVFEHEPLPADHPLRSCPNTVLTPHMGYVSDRQYGQFFGEIVEDIAAYLAGSPIRLVNPPS